eukprot:NODE_170_length_16226_cov_0.451169.p7 type:complete len:328 gc:universal NODE_170_length_16226_cov_0.451169:3424-4407(+)
MIRLIFNMTNCEWENCNEIGFDSKDLYDHIQSTHVGYKRHGTLTNLCKWTGCSFTTERRDRMRSHILCHISTKLYECDTCTKAYKWKHDLYSHQRKFHGKEKMKKPTSKIRKKSLKNVNLDFGMRGILSIEKEEKRSAVNMKLKMLNIQDDCNPEHFNLESSISPSTTEYSTPSLSPHHEYPRRHSMHSYGCDYNQLSPTSDIARRLSDVPQLLQMAVPGGEPCVNNELNQEQYLNPDPMHSFPPSMHSISPLAHETVGYANQGQGPIVDIIYVVPPIDQCTYPYSNTVCSTTEVQTGADTQMIDSACTFDPIQQGYPRFNHGIQHK